MIVIAYYHNLLNLFQIFQSLRKKYLQRPKITTKLRTRTCLFMLIPQVVVVGFLLHWAATWYAVCVSALVVVQVCLMPTLIASPARKAPWYNATGVSLFVSGMMVCAFALRAMS